jgi:hypothetical protein
MLAAVLARAQEGTVPAPITVDHRGLLEVNGILRMNSEGNWGASNLIIKPHGGWAAQDYCLQNVKKSGNTIAADFNTNPKIRMVQTVTQGNGVTQVSYALTPASGRAASYEKVYVSFPFATADFANGKAILDDGTELVLPDKPAGDIALPHETRSITITNGKNSFTVKASDLRISLHDLRPKTTAFQVWLEYPEPRNRTSMQLSFEVSAGVLPYIVKADGKEWIELPYDHDVQDGSILDFSFLADGPAGKHGRIVAKDGHLAYEQTGERARLIGTNLCYTANYLEKPEADRLAAHFRKMGYNTVRLHHTDVHIRKGNWNSNVSDDIDPAYLDRLDYLFAAMKKAGLYVTIDLYTQRRFDRGEIAGIDRVVEGEIKGLVPIHEPAFDAWKKLVVKWMNHVNPYTGIAWKEDPALLSVCPLNEDSVASAWSDVAKPFYLKRFAEWKQARNLVGEETDPAQDPLFAQFLIEVKMASDKRIEAFLRELGVKAMITGSNWWNTMGQAFTRDQFDLVDNHQYSDHPQPHWLPSKYNQQSNLKSHYTYMVPIFMASTRIFGKPFTVSEYNYCAPNQFRAEGGALMGAYAALQDWDGLYRFAWAHDERRVNDRLSMLGFDMSSDPLNQLTERQIVLLFRRGDVAPGNRKYVYAVTMADATRQGVGDMWAKGLFPHAFNAMALVSQTGSQVIAGDRRIEGTFTGVVTDTIPVGEAALNGNAHVPLGDLPKVGKEVASDTGEIVLDSARGCIKVQSPRTECIVAPMGIDITARNLSVAGNDGFCSVSASSMDGKGLDSSERILLLHLTNVLSSGMKFTSKDMTTLTDWGKLPHVVRAGSVQVTLKNKNLGMRVYACDLAGRRVGDVKADYANGAYVFKAEISANRPHMIYELVAHGTPTVIPMAD